MKSNKLTPEDIRAEVDGTGIKDLIGKWIAIEGTNAEDNRIIISAEVGLRDGKPSVGIIALNKQAIEAASTGQRADRKQILAGDLLLFSAQENKGHLRVAGRTLAFSVGDQSETPPSLKMQLGVLQKYPAGETIDLPDSITRNHTPRIPFKEAILIGYNLAPGMDQSREKWMGMVAVAAEARPGAQSFLVPAPLLLLENIMPAKRSLFSPPGGTRLAHNS